MTLVFPCSSRLSLPLIEQLRFLVLRSSIDRCSKILRFWNKLRKTLTRAKAIGLVFSRRIKANDNRVCPKNRHLFESALEILEAWIMQECLMLLLAAAFVAGSMANLEQFPQSGTIEKLKIHEPPPAASWAARPSSGESRTFARRKLTKKWLQVPRMWVHWWRFYRPNDRTNPWPGKSDSLAIYCPSELMASVASIAQPVQPSVSPRDIGVATVRALIANASRKNGERVKKPIRL